jgi:hypothetical protein
MTLGSTNSALYKGDINYVSLPSGTPTYWIVPLDAVLVGGSKVSLTANTRVACVSVFVLRLRQPSFPSGLIKSTCCISIV